MSRLLTEACALPPTPGVYIMHDSSDRVIYVGKSRRLHDRVSQYFREGGKNAKTERMVASVERFECIHCDTEIEALTLENTLIKQYSPRYNIKLKDAKSYPYIKLTPGEYPRLVMNRRRTDDGGRYFGPYSGTKTVFSVISLVNRAFGLPSCTRRFPRDIGKDRPCLYYEMGKCRGVCTGKVSPDVYSEAVRGAVEVLRGNTARVRRELGEQMEQYAENEEYEAAARCRDTIAALGRLTQKQKAVSSPDTDEDVAGIGSDGTCTVLSLLCIREGAIVDKIDFALGADAIADGEAFISLLFEHYSSSEDAPGRLLIGFECRDEDMSALSAFLSERVGRSVPVIVPERGDNKKLCIMAEENAYQAALKYRRDSERSDDAALRLAGLLSLEVVPDRIEAYDISNLGDEHITAGMIVIEGGKFQKRDYRTFTIRSTDGADDYGAMREALTRRFSHLSDDSGSYAVRPDLILLDGGAGHLAVANEVMAELGIDIPAAGMVKDDFHKTRALVTDVGEVNIAREREVFVYIYKIQEEVHRFTVSRMSAAKRKTVKHSSLEKIEGIGPAKARLLLSAFGSLSSLRDADIDAIAGVRGISARDAESVKSYFNSKSASAADGGIISTGKKRHKS